MNTINKVSIIVNLNEANTLAEILLGSINATFDMPYEIIAVNNGGGARLSTLLQNTPYTREIKLQQHIPYPVALNKAIGKISAHVKYVLFVTSDVVFTINAVENLIEKLQKNSEIGLITACTNHSIFFQNYTRNDLKYDDFISLNEVATKVSKNKKTSVTMFQEGFFSLLPKKVLDEVGTFDEEYEDEAVWPFIDFCQRIIRKKYLLKVTEDAYVHREQSLVTPNTQLFQANKEKFQHKWGYLPQYSSYIRRELLQNIDCTKKDLAVLDIGCSAGGNFHFIHDQNNAARLYGVELNKGAAQTARAFAEVQNFDIEKEAHLKWQAKMDYIIMGDVLEHLSDPWKTLKNMYNLLKKDGKIIISVPNVAHISVLYGLLQGNFTYEDSGILDRTHLRFFTQKTAIELVESANFVVKSMFYTYVFQSEQEKNLLKELLHLQTLPVAKENLTAYQWVIVATKKY